MSHSSELSVCKQAPEHITSQRDLFAQRVLSSVAHIDQGSRVSSCLQIITPVASWTSRRCISNTREMIFSGVLGGMRTVKDEPGASIQGACVLAGCFRNIPHPCVGGHLDVIQLPPHLQSASKLVNVVKLPLHRHTFNESVPVIGRNLPRTFSSGKIILSPFMRSLLSIITPPFSKLKSWARELK